MELNFTVIGQIITFFVLLYLLNRFLYKPVSQALRERAEKIRIGLEAADKGRRDLEEAQRQYQEQIEKAKAEAQDIISKAQKRAETLREETVAQSREEAGRMIQKGREEIQVEWEKARLELKREVADLVFLATGKVLGAVIDRDRHMSLVNQVVEGVGEGHVRN